MAYADTIDLGQSVDRDYTRVPSIGPSKVCFVRSFRIRKTNEDKHILTINQNQMIGHYPTRAAALGALIGCYHAAGCNEEKALQAIQYAIDNGRGVIEYSQSLTISYIGGGSISSIISTGDEILHDNTALTWYHSTDRLRLWFGSLNQQTLAAGRYPFKSTAAAEAYASRFQGTISAGTASFSGLVGTDLGSPLTGTAALAYFDSDVDLVDFSASIGSFTIDVRTV